MNTLSIVIVLLKDVQYLEPRIFIQIMQTNERLLLAIEITGVLKITM